MYVLNTTRYDLDKINKNVRLWTGIIAFLFFWNYAIEQWGFGIGFWFGWIFAALVAVVAAYTWIFYALVLVGWLLWELLLLALG